MEELFERRRTELALKKMSVEDTPTFVQPAAPPSTDARVAELERLLELQTQEILALRAKTDEVLARLNQ